MEFKLKAIFNAPAKQIYQAWLSSEGHTNMTGGKAIMNDTIGGEFTAWDGYIEGANLKLEPFTRIVQSWRTSQFHPEEENSQIDILLSEVNGKTELTLIHTNVPESGSHYIGGWEEHYFSPMRTYFS